MRLVDNGSHNNPPAYLKMSFFPLTGGEKSLHTPSCFVRSPSLPFSGGGFNPFRSRNWGNESHPYPPTPSPIPYPSSQHPPSPLLHGVLRLHKDLYQRTAAAIKITDYFRSLISGTASRDSICKLIHTGIRTRSNMTGRKSDSCLYNLLLMSRKSF